MAKICYLQQPPDLTVHDDIINIAQLRVRQHKNILFLFGEPQLPTRQPSRLQLPVSIRQLSSYDARVLLLPSDPVQRHLGSHLIV